MPVNPNMPEPLKSAFEDMEARVQSCKTSLAFAAPEMHDTHWANLQHGLANTIADIYEALTTAPETPTHVDVLRALETLDRAGATIDRGENVVALSLTINEG